MAPISPRTHPQVFLANTNVHKDAYPNGHKACLVEENIECSSACRPSQVEYCAWFLLLRRRCVARGLKHSRVTTCTSIDHLHLAPAHTLPYNHGPNRTPGFLLLLFVSLGYRILYIILLIPFHGYFIHNHASFLSCSLFSVAHSCLLSINMLH